MARALQLATRGLYTTSPNPRVGCVLVKNGVVVGEGFHARTGEPHAEIHALKSAGEAAKGATAYVTLEPCSHFGRTPPCTDALIAAGVIRVVAAVEDPNPEVAGTGISQLRAAGIEVECGLMESDARALNVGFFSRMARKTPWVRSKIGMSLDGRTALANGISQWITNDAARRDVLHWRARSCCILTGIGTVLADNPRLNVRDLPGIERQPARAVMDSHLRMPPEARMLTERDGGPVTIYTATQDPENSAALEKAGAAVKMLSDVNGYVDLAAALRDMAQNGHNEVLVEAGSTLNGALLKAGLIDELLIYVAPQLLGDAARGMAKLGELMSLSEGVGLTWQDVRHVGSDLRIRALVKN